MVIDAHIPRRVHHFTADCADVARILADQAQCSQGRKPRKQFAARSPRRAALVLVQGKLTQRHRGTEEKKPNGQKQIAVALLAFSLCVFVPLCQYVRDRETEGLRRSATGLLDR
jgi:bacterioferritin-associated ferredoxin